MRKQLYYLWRNHRAMRLTTWISFLAISGVLLALNAASRPAGGVSPISIVAVTFTSIGLTALLVVAIIIAVDNSNKLFVRPQAYLTMIAPVKGWKLLAPRIIVTMADIAIALGIGVTMVVAQALVMESGWSGAGFALNRIDVLSIWYLIVPAIGTLQVIVTIYFARTLVHSAFNPLPAKGLLGVLAFVAALWLWSALDIVLLPFAQESGKLLGMWYHISLSMGSLPALCAYTLWSLVRLAALFVPTAMLLEKKANL